MIMNRRSVLLGAAATGAALGSGGWAPPAGRERYQAVQHESRPGRVGVAREWDRLTEVVIGRALDFTFPSSAGHLTSTLAFMPEALRERAAELSGKRWSQADPDGFARCHQQLDTLASFLRARGITVHRPRALTETEQDVLGEFSPLSMQIFVRDPMIVIGQTVIEASLRMPHRFKERFGLRPLIADLTAHGDAQHVVVPPGCPTSLGQIQGADGPFLEGGDVMLFGQDILVGVGEGNFATDQAGAAWLRHQLGDQYRVHPIPLHPRVLHLDDGLAAVKEGLAVVARDQFTQGLPDLIADWDLIDVTLDEALNLLAANLLVLAPGEVIVDSRVPHLAKALDRHNVTVHTLDFDAVTPFAGGFRCSHHPIRRTPEA